MLSCQSDGLDGHFCELHYIRFAYRSASLWQSDRCNPQGPLHFVKYVPANIRWAFRNEVIGCIYIGGRNLIYDELFIDACGV